MTTSERLAWFRYAQALDASWDLYREAVANGGQPTTKAVLESMAKVDAARDELKACGVNPYTGNRMDSRGCDVKPKR